MSFIPSKGLRNFLSVRLFAIVVLSVIPLYSFFNNSLFYTQDGWTHLVRGAAFYKGLSDFNIPVRWAGDLNYGYGMPLFIFVFQLPYILFSFLVFVGLGLALSFKILLFSSYLLSGVFMYLFAKTFFKNETVALFVAISYQFFPYRFVDILLRGSIGEAFTFSFLPVVLYGIVKLNSKKSIRSAFLIITLGILCLLLSHLATGLVFVVVSLFFLIMFSKKKEIFTGLTAILFGFLLSSYYFLPAIVEHKYTYGDLFAKNLYLENFASLARLFMPNITNDKSLRVGDIPTTIGLVPLLLLIVLVASFIFIRRFERREKKIIIYSLAISIVSIFMMSEYSKALWGSFVLLRQFQFPWRFLAPIGFSLAFFGGVIAQRLEKKKSMLLIGGGLVAIFSSTAFWIPQLGFRKIIEKDYWNYPLTTTYFGETDVIWSAGHANEYPKQRVEVIDGKAQISNFIKKNQYQSFDIKSLQNSSLVSHTQYFPGWKVFIDNLSTPIQFQDPNHRGEITFFVPSGEHKIKIEFQETKVRLLSDALTLVGLITLFPFILFLKRRYYES